MYCFSNLYPSTKTQSSIDLFVSNCIRASYEDLVSGVNLKGANDTSCPTCSDLFGSTQVSDII